MQRRPELTLEELRKYVEQFTSRSFETAALIGRSDGKSVASIVEAKLQDELAEHFCYRRGNTGAGLEWPDLPADLKITDVRRPQSSAPYRSICQRIWGLGYHLVVLGYRRSDQNGATKLTWPKWTIIEAPYTADYRSSSLMRKLVEAGASDERLLGALEGLGCDAGDESRLHGLLQRLRAEPPVVGLTTMTPALQWRMSYRAALTAIRTRG